MNTFYTDERNTQILISVMKSHGIKKVVASPGATNVSFIASIQQDDFFEIYSAIDERSACYMACGLAEESNEVVALSCTGATASRNYMPGLTEAFYRKLPILVITSTQSNMKIGHNIPQVIDRRVPLNDTVKMSVQLPSVNTAQEEWACIINTNKAILELDHHGKGPVHINLETTFSDNFTIKELPEVKVINRFNYKDELPELNFKNVAIFVGAHSKWSDKLTEIVDKFCEIYNGVVLCDHTSNYWGKYRVLANAVTNQELERAKCCNIDLLIHIGNISGAYMNISGECVWRVNPDGELCDTFGKLQNVFEMDEISFFSYYTKNHSCSTNKCDFAESWKAAYVEVENKIPELPFSNAWVAQTLSKKIPLNSVIHFGILNSLRCWNFFDVMEGTLGYCNTGGFGIDGCVSSLIGAALTSPQRIYFGIVGDLAFFYDLNSLGNKHIGNNVRLIIINNGRGQEFRNYSHRAAKFGEDADEFMAAAGHFGNKHPYLVKHYAEDLGFRYLKAVNKEEFNRALDIFVSPEVADAPIIFEVFTDTDNENMALKKIVTCVGNEKTSVKRIVKNIIGEKGVERVRRVVKK